MEKEFKSNDINDSTTKIPQTQDTNNQSQLQSESQTVFVTNQISNLSQQEDEVENRGSMIDK